MEEGKECKGKLMRKNKRQRTSGGRDRLSELPDYVLLRIMEFMDIKHSVQTCILSKRWKDLWKRLTSLTSLSLIHPGTTTTLTKYNKFVSRFLSSRDHSVSLHHLDFVALGSAAPTHLNSIVKYAVLHNVQQLTIYIDFNFRKKPPSHGTSNILNPSSITSLVPLIFSCPSLTFLKLSIKPSSPPLELPNSLQLPALKTLLLTNVSFTASNNDCAAEPFSTCNLLNTLLLKHCFLHKDANVLCISNSNLSTLNLGTFQNNIVLSTPNLNSLTIIGRFTFSYLQLSSTCSLSFLEEVNIDTRPDIDYSIITSRLQLLTNVKILTLSSGTLKIILNALSNHATMRTQPPCFGRLESLKVKMDPHIKISKEEVNRTLEYLLQNSPRTRVDVINS